MNICVAGLGLIGGSLALALKRAGYRVDGYNRSQRALNYALSHNVIDGEAEDFSDYDVVFVALPPEAAVAFMITTSFKDGAVVSDVCGVKECIESEIYAEKRNFRYIGTHPMAGKEVSGVENACADLFDKASMVITHCAHTDFCALNTVKSLVKDMGFKRIVECEASLHDRKIAYTSQLAHVVSNSYVKDAEISGCLGFTGGSFQDMTRIAGVDENVWTELYLKNSRNLLSSTRRLRDSLSEFISVLESADESGDETVLRRYLSVGARIYREGKAENFVGEGITVTELK